MAITEATGATLETHLKEGIPTVIDFWAEWCVPCKKLLPTIEELAKQYGSSLKFIKINVDSDEGVASKYQVMSIPTLVFIHQGKEVDRVVGAMGKDALVKKINALFNI